MLILNDYVCIDVIETGTGKKKTKYNFRKYLLFYN